MPEPTDDLIRRAKAKDHRAFEALVERFRPALEKRVRARMSGRLRQHVEVGDVIQETLLKAYENIDKLEWRGEEAFGRWLACLAEQLIWKHLRGSERAPLALEGDLPGSEPSASRSLGREERLRRLEQALAGVSPEHRQVIVLARLERRSVDEIAACMSRSPNAVKKLLGRALIELRHHFGDTTGSLRLPDLPLEIGGRNHGD